MVLVCNTVLCHHVQIYNTIHNPLVGIITYVDGSVMFLKVANFLTRQLILLMKHVPLQGCKKITY
jgi:hypothetical protein